MTTLTSALLSLSMASTEPLPEGEDSPDDAEDYPLTVEQFRNLLQILEEADVVAFDQRNSILTYMANKAIEHGVFPWGIEEPVAVIDVKGRGIAVIGLSGEAYVPKEKARIVKKVIRAAWKAAGLPHKPDPLEARRQKLGGRATQVGSAILAGVLTATGFGAAFAPAVAAAGGAVGAVLVNRGNGASDEEVVAAVMSAAPDFYASLPGSGDAASGS